MSDITNEKLYAGDSFQWSESISLYPPDTHTIIYYLQKSDETPYEIESTPDSGEHLFSKASSATKNLESGTYTFQKKAKAISDGSLKTFDIGSVEILSGLEAGVDSRTFNRKILDALKNMALGRATREQQKIEVSGRAIEYLTLTEINDQIEIYEAKVAAEIRESNGESAVPAIRLSFEGAQ